MHWAFVWATGRSGSTTILEMLNAVPCVALSGENGRFMEVLQTLDTVTRDLHGGTAAWRNRIAFDKLARVEADWIALLMDDPRRSVAGFKEVRTQSIPFVVHLFPDAHHIISYRRNHTSQVQSRPQDFNATDASLTMHEAAIRRALAKQNTFELPLEDFGVDAFNAMLRWLGIPTFRFSRVLHSNDGGYNSDARPVCERNCTCGGG